jgi:hypothetical protein
MFQFTDYIDPLSFFIAFAIGIFLVYIYSPAKKIIIKWPTPENIEKTVYKDHSDSCYKYKANEVSCPDDKSLITNIDAQYNEGNKEKNNLIKL